MNINIPETEELIFLRHHIYSFTFYSLCLPHPHSYVFPVETYSQKRIRYTHLTQVTGKV